MASTYKDIVTKFQPANSEIADAFSLTSDYCDTAKRIITRLYDKTQNDEINTLCNQLILIPDSSNALPMHIQTMFNNWNDISQATKNYIYANSEKITTAHDKLKNGFENCLEMVNAYIGEYEEKEDDIVRKLKAAKKIVTKYVKRRNVWAKALMGNTSDL